jgi:hypothetical protein
VISHQWSPRGNGILYPWRVKEGILVEDPTSGRPWGYVPTKILYRAFSRLTYARPITWHAPIFTSCAVVKLSHVQDMQEDFQDRKCITWKIYSYPHLLSNCETRVYPGIRRWNLHLFEWARRQETIGGILFTRKRRAETLQLGSEFDYFKPGLKPASNASPGWTVCFFFSGWSSEFRRRRREFFQKKEESQDLSNGINVAC